MLMNKWSIKFIFQMVQARSTHIIRAMQLFGVQQILGVIM